LYFPYTFSITKQVLINSIGGAVMKEERMGHLKAFLFLGIVILLALNPGCCPEKGPVIETQFGPVQGYVDKASTWVWKAIPYAKPPVGPLRWKAPEDPDPWIEIRDTRKYCSPCTQHTFFYRSVTGSEDCLYLNIWRPQTAETNLPVYFWIHGGGNSAGAAWSLNGSTVTLDYSGANLASTSNFVFVSVNYRLGPLGWFTHPALREDAPGSEKDDSGNYGTLDLIKALTWVQDNIEAFGGNPDRVMIFGESAGGWNVHSLLISPLAKGLFHTAMSQSGGPMMSSVAEGEESARNAIKRLLVNDGTALDLNEAQAYLDGMSDSEIEDYLRVKTGPELFYAHDHWLDGGFLDVMIDFPFPFQDGTVFPETGYETLADGSYPNKVPIILGTTKEELKTFAFLDPYFFGKPDLYQIAASYGSDSWKAWAVDQVARKLTSHMDQPAVYAYQFLWGAGGDPGQSQLPDPWGFWYGACHGLDVPFFFGNENEPLSMFFHLLLWTEENRPGREALADAMMRYVARFARTGDPNEPGSDLPEWSPWSNDSGGPKCILFDVHENQSLDIEMSTVELTQEGVKQNLAHEVPEPLYSEALYFLEQDDWDFIW
jgi:para-nitrobenzyl esterase